MPARADGLGPEFHSFNPFEIPNAGPPPPMPPRANEFGVGAPPPMPARANESEPPPLPSHDNVCLC